MQNVCKTERMDGITRNSTCHWIITHNKKGKFLQNIRHENFATFKQKIQVCLFQKLFTFLRAWWSHHKVLSPTIKIYNQVLHKYICIQNMGGKIHCIMQIHLTFLVTALWQWPTWSENIMWQRIYLLSIPRTFLKMSCNISRVLSLWVKC